jgi:hypothetical protein
MNLSWPNPYWPCLLTVALRTVGRCGLGSWWGRALIESSSIFHSRDVTMECALPVTLPFSGQPMAGGGVTASKFPSWNRCQWSRHAGHTCPLFQWHLLMEGHTQSPSWRGDSAVLQSNRCKIVPEPMEEREGQWTPAKSKSQHAVWSQQIWN